MQITPYSEFQARYDGAPYRIERPAAVAEDRLGQDGQAMDRQDRTAVDKIREARIGAALYRYESTLADMTVKALAETLGLGAAEDDFTDPLTAQDPMVHSLYAQPLLHPGRGRSVNQTI